MNNISMKLVRQILWGVGALVVVVWLARLVWVQVIIRSRVNYAVQQCYAAKDLSVAVKILKQTLEQYPQAPDHQAAAELLKTYELKLAQTEALSKVIAQVNITPAPAAAMTLLKEGMNNYPEAINQNSAQRLLKGYELRQAETESLATAMQYATQSEDTVYSITMLTQTLNAYPGAYNRKEAEQLVAKLKLQQLADEGLVKAMTNFEESPNAPDSIRQLEEALVTCAGSQYREKAEKMLAQHKKQSSETLADAMTRAKATNDAFAAFMILKEALEQYPSSPDREEAEKLMANYQKNINAATVVQKLSPTAVSARPADHYAFLPPGQMPAKPAQPLILYESPVINKMVRPPCSLELQLAAEVLMESNEQTGSASSMEITKKTAMHYAPRLTITKVNNAVPAESLLVIEYFTSPDNSGTDVQRQAVERIPTPEIGKGKILACDADGIKLNLLTTVRGGVQQKTDSRKFYGMIISLFDPQGALLIQKYTAPNLLKACSTAP